MDDLLRQFSEAPARLGWVQAHLADPEVVEALLQAVDDSPYSLGQWIDAFVVLDQWLEAKSLSASIEDQMGYLHCVAEAAGSGAVWIRLEAFVSEMLAQYGFEHVRPRDGS